MSTATIIIQSGVLLYIDDVIIVFRVCHLVANLISKMTTTMEHSLQNELLGK